MSAETTQPFYEAYRMTLENHPGVVVSTDELKGVVADYLSNLSLASGHIEAPHEPHIENDLAYALLNRAAPKSDRHLHASG